MKSSTTTKTKQKHLDANAAEFIPVARESSTSSEMSDQACIICSEKRIYTAIGPCNHPICSVCSLRLRFRSKDLTCPICKQTSEFVIIFRSSTGPKSFVSFGIEDIDSRLPGVVIDHSTNMAFYNCRDHHKSLMDMKSMKCPVQSCNYSTNASKSLLKHIETDHNGLRLCALCLEHRPIFLHEQELFKSDSELKNHQKTWGLDGKGHPSCGLCRKSFFDSSHLYRHLNETHISCHLCPSDMCNRFYRDESALNTHISDNHIICTVCEKEGNLAAFTSHTSYMEHMAEVHYERVNPTTLYFGYEGKLSGRPRVDYFDFVTGNRAQSTNSVTVIPTGDSSRAFADIPANMRISGRVTGTGNYTRDESDDNLQAYIDGLSSTINKIRKNVGSIETNRIELFPPLQATQSSGSSKATSTYHPMSIVPELQTVESRKRVELELEAQRQQELDSRRQKRNEMLADAFGVSTAISASSLLADIGLSKDYASATASNHYIDILHSPLYPSNLLAWAVENYKELVQIEKKIADLIADKSTESLQLKTMPRASRLSYQVLAKYYDINSYEYDAVRGKYVSFVKTPTSSIPHLLLSNACKSKEAPITIASSISSPANVYFSCQSIDLYAYFSHRKVRLNVDSIIKAVSESYKRCGGLPHTKLSIMDITLTGPSTLRILFPSHDLASEVVKAINNPLSIFQKDGYSTFIAIHHPYDIEDSKITKSPNIVSNSITTKTTNEQSVDNIAQETDSWLLDNDIVIGDPNSPSDSVVHIEELKIREVVSTSVDDWELLDIKDDKLSPLTHVKDLSEQISTDNDMPRTSTSATSGKYMRSPWSNPAASTNQRPQKIANKYEYLDSNDESDSEEDQTSNEETAMYEKNETVRGNRKEQDDLQSIEIECRVCENVNILSFEKLSVGATCFSCQVDLIQ